MTRASKTLPPETPSATIERPSLEGRLEDALARRLTVLVAGAGFGKTTLLAQWAGKTGCAWYTIEREDAALGVFATGILAAFRQRGVDLPPEERRTPTTRRTKSFTRHPPRRDGS